LDNARVPYIRVEGVEGFFYEKGGIVGYFSHQRLPEFLLRNGYQVGAPVFHKRRPHEGMFGSILLPSPEVVNEVGEETAYAYIRGEELKPYRADGWYIIAFRGKLLGHVKVSGGKASNKLPRPFHIFM
jgi:NOL1/NOP2/fmu family ribosome biogenesis protein